MRLTRLEISDFRNIKKAEISPHPSLNLVTGENGSGKSSILEAIQCLSTGHSFRTRQSRELIHREASAYTVSALFADPTSEREHRAGLMRRRDGAVELRLDFETVTSLSEVTQLLPIKALTPDSHKLVQEGPDERRLFLDWGVFHMEPGFFDIWRQFKRSLAQRNQLLREGFGATELKSWDDIFVQSAEAIDQYRGRYITALQFALTKRLEMLDGKFHVELKYRRGWKTEAALSELLSLNLDYHQRMKTTTDGPHRAEVAMSSGGVPVKQLFSRGQQKILVYLLHLAQLDLMSIEKKRKAIVLCDDLTSELDANHIQRIVQQLIETQSQVFVSGVDLSALSSHRHNRFHMEHGAVEKVV